MKNIQLILIVLLGALLINPIASQAEDIDIYTGVTGTANIPNVMIVVDNPSSQNNAVGPCTYWDNTLPSQGSNALGNDQCALVNIVHGMTTRTGGVALVNLGMTTMDGVVLKLTPLDDNTYTGPASVTFPSISYTVPSGSTNRQAIIIAVKALNQSVGKSGQGSEFQETWAYYTGGNGGTTGTGMLSGVSYTGVNTSTSCKKEFIIYLSNVKANAGHAQDNGEYPSPYLTLAINNAVALGTLTAAQGTALLTAIPNNTEAGWAREWARFMYNNDSSSMAAGSQGIITYSIATGDTAVPPATITNNMEIFIQAVANFGGGRYFAAGTSYDVLYEAILKILNEVQAVNSVFASSSLPVSVNAQGTFLNQIYMGMFRPDATGLPRWVGNLKQYHFCFNTTTQVLSLCDSLGKSAISGAGTGFISPNAVSYWTTKNVGVEPDLNGGFWRNKPQGAALGYDSPDGELVEKGGAAQMSRGNYLLNNYTSYPSTPRNFYTYCPGGPGTCVAALTNSANLFSTANAAITAGSFGSASTVNVTSLTRSGTVATVTTATPHNLIAGSTVTISNADQSQYNGTFTVVTVPSTTMFTITVPEYPPQTATGSYTASVASTPQVIRSATVAGSITRNMNTAAAPNVATATVTMVTNHGYASNDLITINGATQTKYNGAQTITVTGLNTFTYPVVVQPVSPAGGATATATSNVTTKVKGVTTTTAVTVSIVNTGGVVLGAETAVGSAPVTVTTTTAHGFTVGNTVTLANVVDTSGNAVTQYNGNFTITSVGATTFTYTTATTPPSPATIDPSGTAITADKTTNPAVALTRSTGNSTTATATGTTLVAHGYTVGQNVSIGGTQGANEAGYVGTFPITSVPTTTTFTYTVTLTPVTPATGIIKATSTGVVLNSTTLINWVRGEDNFLDETSPDPSHTAINVRPSLHGDVLHSRPTVINYGGTIGVVVYYGANDGVFRAVNGNQSNPTGSTMPTPGSELWSFIPSEFIIKLARMHDNSPVLKLASTPPGILPSPQTKDYFIDGSSSVYQKMNADGTTNTAYLYLAMRRGGELIYALDVTTPTAPSFLWEITSADADFTEVTQTWSQPKVTFVKGYCGGTTCSSSNLPTPVMIFGGGYDNVAEDIEPPAASTQGRGIFIVNALNGHLIWKATYGASSACSGTTVKATCTVAGMNYSIPSDITLMDISGNDGYIDRLYAADVGGNIWRVDLEPTATHITPDYWQVTKLAALGCNTGACASGTTPRKFLYPADMVPTADYDAVLIGSGDREHPLYSTATNSAYSVTNRFYMVKDLHTGNDATATPAQALVTEADLVDITPVPPATATSYDGTRSGYYLTLGAGEKVVNAPLTVAGYTYFGTNTPATPSSNACTTNLGTAKGYQISPLTGKTNSIVYDGGGLPPSPVAGSVAVDVNGTTMTLPFCIGCGGDATCVGSDCKTPIGGGKPPITVSTSRSRTYWYKESD